MIRHFCDYCGRECAPGDSVRDHAVAAEFNLTKQHLLTEHTKWRTSRVRIDIGIDSTEPQTTHPGHDLCNACITAILRAVLAELEEPE